MLIDLHTYLLFIAAAVVLVISPGPDMAYMLARTVAQGRRAGVMAAVGINLGGYVHVFASAAGLTAILASSSVAFTAVKLAGAAYLVWIGIQSIRARSDSLQIDPNSGEMRSGKTIFWQGFVSDVLNPKVAVFFLAFLPQFVDTHSQTLTVTQQLLILGITCNVVAISINVLIVYCAGVATARLRSSPTVVGWLNKAAGAVFVGLGVRLAAEKI